MVCAGIIKLRLKACRALNKEITTNASWLNALQKLGFDAFREGEKSEMRTKYVLGSRKILYINISTFYLRHVNCCDNSANIIHQQKPRTQKCYISNTKFCGQRWYLEPTKKVFINWKIKLKKINSLNYFENEWMNPIWINFCWPCQSITYRAIRWNCASRISSIIFSSNNMIFSTNYLWRKK